MIKYWPVKQSIELNLAVSNLFAQTYEKFSCKLYHKSSFYIPIDIFSQNTKKQLVLVIIAELEALILDIVELNLNIKEVKKISSHMLLNLINIIVKKMLRKLEVNVEYHDINLQFNYNKLFFQEHIYAIYTLLAYLVFGSEKITGSTFSMYSNKTPFHHIKALLENAVIQTSGIVGFNLLEAGKFQANIFFSIYHENILNYASQPIRQLSNFKNNLISQSFISLYIYYPQNIYRGRYYIWLLSSRRIIHQSIRLNQVFSYLKLSNYQLNSIIYLEVQDFIVPRLNSTIIFIGKLLVYIFNKVIKKKIGAGLKHIVKKLNTKKY